ncbi:MAG: hypothetical protein IPQ07_12195 [Myxococcales bacterium]|nr:hypothetical protein [Myxococcales bacterium]
MLHALLPLISIALGLATPAQGADQAEEPLVVTAPKIAQVRLAEALAEADAIHAVGRRGQRIVFRIDRDGEALEVVVGVRTKGKARGAVASLSITAVGPATGDLGSLSWLGAELADATAITALAVDEDGAVTITTSDGRTYMAIPGRGSGGNAAVEARWAAAWDAPA